MTRNRYAMHPEARAILAQMAAADAPPFETMTPDEARDAARAFTASGAFAPDAVASAEDISIPSAHGAIGARLYRPLTLAPERPGLLFLHGGGWVMCDLDTHDDICRMLCARLGCILLSVDYRLAPEHPFPAAIEDCLDAARWFGGSAAALGFDPDYLMVAGDSAGANMASVVALAAVRGDAPPVCYQMLFYPVTDLGAEAASYARCESGVQLTAPAMRWMRDLYLRDRRDGGDWRASPLRSDSLADAPPAFILTCHHDPLCDEGRAYADRLAAEGVDVTHVHLTNHMHGILSLGAVLSDAAACIDMAVGATRAALHSLSRRTA